MVEAVDRAGLKVDASLARFVEERALPGTGIQAIAFWRGMADVFLRFVPENRALLVKRDNLQRRIDAWQESKRGAPIDTRAHEAFLRQIGYLETEPEPFTVATENVDDEIARI